MEFVLAVNLHIPPSEAQGMSYPHFRWHYRRWLQYHDDYVKELNKRNAR